MNITIVGGGFGGVRAALLLAKRSNHQITLISDRDYFQYTPSLYSTATGRSQMESWIPLGIIFGRYHNIRVIIDTIKTIDPKAKQLVGISGERYTYGKCILALGSVTTHFGIKGLPEYSHGVKSKDEIRELKQHLHQKISQRGFVDRMIVVIGGGPTGVELAASTSTYVRSLYRRYGVRQRTFRVRLVEASPRLLPAMSPATSRAVTRRLRRLGVLVMTGKKVNSASKSGIVVDGKSLATETIIWTSGAATHPFYSDNSDHFEVASNGKVVVDDYLKAAPGVYVIGDNADTPYSGLAQTALHDAGFVAKNLMRESHLRAKYRPRRQPMVVPVGRRWAAFEWRGLHFNGIIGATIRRFADLVGYMDILPLSKALALWQWGGEPEHVYFASSQKTPKSR